ncbi:MAG: UvrD-helicase domain-containing protein, partial [Actinomycetes bacterium]
MERVAKYSPEEIVAKLGLKPVTTYQSEIISSPLEPSVVIAGAGSGKTETMSNRV